MRKVSSYIAIRAQYALISTFPEISDKETGWNDVIQLTKRLIGFRRTAGEVLGSVFCLFPNKEKAWNDLHQLILDENITLRWRATYALGIAFPYIPDKASAWHDLRLLIMDEDEGIQKEAIIVLGSVFNHITNKEQAWNDLIWLTGHSKNIDNVAHVMSQAILYIDDKEKAWNDLYTVVANFNLRLGYRTKYANEFSSALGSLFSQFPKKEQMLDDLYQLIRTNSNLKRGNGAILLGSFFSQIPDKKHAWAELRRLLMDQDKIIKKQSLDALDVAFPHIPDKDQAYNDLLFLTQNKRIELQVLDIIDSSFSQFPDKDRAWDDMLNLILKTDVRNRRRIVNILGTAYPFISNNNRVKAYNDLIFLTQNENKYIRRRAISVIGLAFPYIPEKEQAWNALIRFSYDHDSGVRRIAASNLGSVFSYTTNKERAWNDLIGLTQNEDSFVRYSASYGIGSAFQYISNDKKNQALNILYGLTHDEHKDVQASAYHSLGQTFIYNAIEAENDEDFKIKFEKAIEFFETSSIKAFYYNNPSQFCLPFYQSFYAITFKKHETEIEIQKYLSQAKSAISDSESKDQLLKIIENLASALKEAQKDENFALIKSNLKSYRRYCDHAANLLETTEEKAPGATKLIQKGLPIIDERIKDILAEIQEKTEEVCKESLGTSFEDLGKEVNKIGQNLLIARDPIGLKKSVDNLESALSDICNRMNDKEKDEACKLLEKCKNEQYIEYKIDLINMILTKIPSLLVTEQGNNSSKTYLIDANKSSITINEESEIKQQKSGISNVEGLITKKKDGIIKTIIELFNPPATIAAFVGFIISELLDVYPTNYNKHMMSIVIAMVIFFIILIFTRNKN